MMNSNSLKLALSLFIFLVAFTSYTHAQTKNELKPPVYPGCEKFEKNTKKLKKCFTEKISRHISNEFNRAVLPEFSGQKRYTIKILVDFEGNTSIKESSPVTGEIYREFERVFSTAPRVKPAIHKGSPVNITYDIPIVFTQKRSKK